MPIDGWFDYFQCILFKVATYFSLKWETSLESVKLYPEPIFKSVDFPEEVTVFFLSLAPKAA